MLKHQEIIDKMTDREKIAFLCNINSLSERRLRELGIAKLKLGDMKKAQYYWEKARKSFPSLPEEAILLMTAAERQ